MRSLGTLSSILAAALLATPAGAQLSIPRIVQLPTNDFTWVWGDPPESETRRYEDFTVRGVEENFICTAEGAFRPASRMREVNRLREFEQMLSSTIFFISDSTYHFNTLRTSNQLDWAFLECAIPEETEESRDEAQERVDRALERARREQERRRDRDR